ncbi:hypothetical protein BDA99DRAFT_511836 [Phascolomyces articulosus]|uniref:CAP-Gly domain-containing protein n=1 Tax=Phascolomyces articulosus TaxID=60185 RepID=A0AAD5K8U7_9FUNG|nr:hypothetical protein BDA99DRAFT_511836 [Phascolomyces articulosus]
MFTPPRKTLHSSLHKLLDCAQEYLADVCFHYPCGKIWAHRAIIVARAPNEFITTYLSELIQNKQNNNGDSLKLIDIEDPIIPYTTLQHLLRYWYTGEFLHATPSEQDTTMNSATGSSDVSSLSTLSLTSTQTSASLMTLSTIQSNTSQCEVPTPSSSDANNSNTYADIMKEIQDQEKRLGTALLFRSQNSSTATTTEGGNTTMTNKKKNHSSQQHPMEQLKADIATMYDHHEENKQLGQDDYNTSDVTLKLFSNPNANKTTTVTTASASPTLTTPIPAHQQFAVHRCILASQSSHFYAMFCKEFREASSSTVYLSSDIFSPTSFNVILRYYYTDTLQLPPGPANDTSPPHVESPHHQSLARKKYSLRLLHDAFRVADYLGDYDTVGRAILFAMAELCNHFKCTCHDCAALLPSMLWFSDKYKSHVSALRLNLIHIYSEPVHSLASLWSAPPFAILADSKTSDIVSDIVAQITANIKKQTAIQVLEALHLCLSRIRRHPPLSSSSSTTVSTMSSFHKQQPPVSTVQQILDNLVSHTVSMISDNFEFYCVEYPILLSCVDGIAVGSGLSVDFLEFLLTRVMQEGIHDRNAGELYQSIVRDLIGRQEMDQDKIVDNVLVEAYQQCVAYLANRWSHVKALGGFKKVEKDIMRRLSEDIEVPYRSLTKSTFETDLAALFGFKSRSTKSKKSEKVVESEYGAVRRNSAASLSYRRLSLLSLRSRRSHDSLATTRTTSSASNAAAITTISSTVTAPPNMLTNQQQQHHISSHHRDLLTTPLATTSIHHSTSSSPSLQELVRDTIQNNHHHTISHHPHTTTTASSSNGSRASSSSSLLTDALLPMEHSNSSNSPSMTTSSSTPVRSSSTPGQRPSRLRFELPTMPQRPSSAVSESGSNNGPVKILLQPRNKKKNKNKKNSNSNRRSHSPLRARLGWGSTSNSDASDDEEGQNRGSSTMMPVLGAKVELLRRPLPMRGTIKYIGQVQFAKGTYVGVELDERLGNNDGAYNDVRYFHTDQQRGAFCKLDDFKILSMPTTSSTSSSSRA